MRSKVWTMLVPVVCLVAGVGFATSAHDAGGTELRAPGIASLADTVRTAQGHVRSENRQVSTLQREIDRATTRAGDGGASAARAALSRLRPAGGLVAEHGPGLTVVLDDAVQADGSPIPSDSGVDPNQLVVHQSDLQAVVNALWAGGAEGMTIAGQRVIATSAVRCVGNTLLLGGELYSPPYRVEAVGPATTMTQRLDTSDGVHAFREAAEYFGLGYTVETSARIDLPAYRGTSALLYARPGK